MLEIKGFTGAGKSKLLKLLYEDAIKNKIFVMVLEPKHVEFKGCNTEYARVIQGETQEHELKVFTYELKDLIKSKRKAIVLLDELGTYLNNDSIPSVIKGLALKTINLANETDGIRIYTTIAGHCSLEEMNNDISLARELESLGENITKYSN